MSIPDAIADALQNHPIQDGGISCGCGEWRAWADDGPNGCWEEHATGHIVSAILRVAREETT